LIAKNMALTAAHCVDQGTDGMVVIFGTDIQADARDAVQVIGAEIQPAWSQAHPDDQDMGDIAVVRFASDAPESFKPAHLASKKMSLKAGDTVTLAGYGITRANSQKGVGVLRKVDVKVLNPSLGETEMVLDQSDGSGACHGDSGGPAFLVKDGKTYLVGVTNRSYPDTAVDDCKHQVVYTKVMPYRSWIADSEKELKRMK
jgi:secreted trypsin-like serine protease